MRAHVEFIKMSQAAHVYYICFCGAEFRKKFEFITAKSQRVFRSKSLNIESYVDFRPDFPAAPLQSHLSAPVAGFLFTTFRRVFGRFEDHTLKRDLKKSSPKLSFRERAERFKARYPNEWHELAFHLILRTCFQIAGIFTA